MVNHWLPYQSLACRIRARSAFYQASGAFGFRDQLQDTLALLLHDPQLAREQILNAARRQFPEGDVQHWWLPRTGAGVRTMISDDVVWLAYAVASLRQGHRRRADARQRRCLSSRASRWQRASTMPSSCPRSSQEVRHDLRALRAGARPCDVATGASGLPLILGGDWNDGMNRVGEAGKGESVWLGWFLLKTLGNFARIARGAGRRQARQGLGEACARS